MLKPGLNAKLKNKNTQTANVYIGGLRVFCFLSALLI